MLAATHLQAYLARHAEADALRAAQRVNGTYQRALVVPCFDEPDDLLDSLLPSDAEQLLVVLVANAPDNASAPQLARTKALLKLGSVSSDSETVLDSRRNVGLLVIDRVSLPLPRRRGVGLARKIGSDCAAALIHNKQLRHSWIYTTDADVRLPAGYFVAQLPDQGAAMFPFRHRGQTAEMQNKADLYELHLCYYAERLAWAGSPYAFHSLGSTLAVHARAYAMVRGYPRRNAGEDFHMLNKLAKVAPIHCLAEPTLEIQARHSNRTPFGTGVALAKIHGTEQYESYAPESFALLRQVLRALDDAGEKIHSRIDPRALGILQELGFDRFRLRQHAQNQRATRKAMHDWFDGLKTLRFIHECRRHYPDVPLRATLGLLYPHLAGHSPADQLRGLSAIRHFADPRHANDAQRITQSPDFSPG